MMFCFVRGSALCRVVSCVGLSRSGSGLLFNCSELLAGLSCAECSGVFLCFGAVLSCFSYVPSCVEVF